MSVRFRAGREYLGIKQLERGREKDRGEREEENAPHQRAACRRRVSASDHVALLHGEDSKVGGGLLVALAPGGKENCDQGYPFSGKTVSAART